MLRGYRFSMIDEMMNREYIELYGAAGDAFSEVIDEAPYEMAVLSNLIIYLTKMMRKQESENRGDGAFGREAARRKTRPAVRKTEQNNFRCLWIT